MPPKGLAIKPASASSQLSATAQKLPATRSVLKTDSNGSLTPRSRQPSTRRVTILDPKAALDELEKSIAQSNSPCEDTFAPSPTTDEVRKAIQRLEDEVGQLRKENDRLSNAPKLDVQLTSIVTRFENYNMEQAKRMSELEESHAEQSERWRAELQSAQEQTKSEHRMSKVWEKTAHKRKSEASTASEERNQAIGQLRDLRMDLAHQKRIMFRNMDGLVRAMQQQEGELLSLRGHIGDAERELGVTEVSEVGTAAKRLRLAEQHAEAAARGAKSELEDAQTQNWSAAERAILKAESLVAGGSPSPPPSPQVDAGFDFQLAADLQRAQSELAQMSQELLEARSAQQKTGGSEGGVAPWKVELAELSEKLEAERAARTAGVEQEPRGIEQEEEDAPPAPRDSAAELQEVAADPPPLSQPLEEAVVAERPPSSELREEREEEGGAYAEEVAELKKQLDSERQRLEQAELDLQEYKDSSGNAMFIDTIKANAARFKAAFTEVNSELQTQIDLREKYESEFNASVTARSEFQELAKQLGAKTLNTQSQLKELCTNTGTSVLASDVRQVVAQHAQLHGMTLDDIPPFGSPSIQLPGTQVFNPKLVKGFAVRWRWARFISYVLHKFAKLEHDTVRHLTSMPSNCIVKAELRTARVAMRWTAMAEAFGERESQSLREAALRQALLDALTVHAVETATAQHGFTKMRAKAAGERARHLFQEAALRAQNTVTVLPWRWLWLGTMIAANWRSRALEMGFMKSAGAGNTADAAKNRSVVKNWERLASLFVDRIFIAAREVGLKKVKNKETQRSKCIKSTVCALQWFRISHLLAESSAADTTKSALKDITKDTVLKRRWFALAFELQRRAALQQKKSDFKSLTDLRKGKERRREDRLVDECRDRAFTFSRGDSQAGEAGRPRGAVAVGAAQWYILCVLLLNDHGDGFRSAAFKRALKKKRAQQGWQQVGLRAMVVLGTRNSFDSILQESFGADTAITRSATVNKDEAIETAEDHARSARSMLRWARFVTMMEQEAFSKGDGRSMTLLDSWWMLTRTLLNYSAAAFAEVSRREVLSDATLQRGRLRTQANIRLRDADTLAEWRRKAVETAWRWARLAAAAAVLRRPLDQAFVFKVDARWDEEAKHEFKDRLKRAGGDMEAKRALKDRLMESALATAELQPEAPAGPPPGVGQPLLAWFRVVISLLSEEFAERWRCMARAMRSSDWKGRRRRMVADVGDGVLDDIEDDFLTAYEFSPMGAVASGRSRGQRCSVDTQVSDITEVYQDHTVPTGTKADAIRRQKLHDFILQTEGKDAAARFEENLKKRRRSRPMGLQAGQSVRLCNLISNAEFNGSEGQLVSFDAAAGRWKVLIPHQWHENHLKPENLQPIAEGHCRSWSIASSASVQTSIAEDVESDESQDFAYRQERKSAVCNRWSAVS
eukprot:TRINITY_DN122436_c0_g1_i1.p1 TRINITY_DN122436_c0_g1~~TRINITY_DN122436_c0_g1_i1.p1  ORF type:complete len:1424 (-),score=294.11 TRINITY_DN122436_c0_g1_i1:77-4348(-)